MDWGSVPAWAAVCTAVVGSGLATRQLQLAARSQEHQVQIARANLLLSIDKNFESDEIYKSRKAIRSLRNRAEKAIEARDKPTIGSENLRDEIAKQFSLGMTKLWDDARSITDGDVDGASSPDIIAIDRYSVLTALPNWIETVGMLCRRNLLPKDDVLDLYDQVVISTMQNFKAHYTVRREQPPYANHRLMENAFWLLEEAIAFKAKRETPLPTSPAQSPTRWA